MSWENISYKNIRQCFKHVGFSEETPKNLSSVEVLHEAESFEDLTSTEIMGWMQIGNNISVPGPITDKNVFDFITVYQCFSISAP